MFDLKKPCKLCPFRKDIDPFLGRARAQEIADGLRADGTFYCHQTVEYDDDHWDEDGSYFDNGEEQHCAGAALCLEHEERPNQMMRIAERIGAYDRTKLKGDVFESLKDFEDHHGSG